MLCRLNVQSRAEISWEHGKELIQTFAFKLDFIHWLDKKGRAS